MRENILSYAHLALEWDYEKNNGLKPEDFTGGSKRVVWWKSMSGHSWQYKISNRVEGRGCPYDSGKSCRKLRGLNDA